MKNQSFKTPPLLPFVLAAALLTGIPVAHSGSTVKLSTADTSQPSRQTKNVDSPAWHRKLWDGSFDKASDASGAAARQLEGLDYGDCNEYTKLKDGKQQDPNLYWACVERQQKASRYAQQARNIQKQQKVMSLVSKASDVAAVGAVGATAYGELAMKRNNQADTYESAAHIQRKAGEVSYVTGAADLTMGAYAYVAHKNKLEQIQRNVNGTISGVKAETDPAVAASLTNAIAASKKAAYNHMLWGAGKVAAGYGMMKLSERTKQQADQLTSIDTLQYMNYLNSQQVAGATSATQKFTLGQPSPPPYYQSNAPSFSFPNSGAASLTAQRSGVVNYAVQGGGTGSSVAPANYARGPASANSGKVSGGAGGGGGSDSSGASLPPAEEDPVKAKSTKEAMGNSFDMQLTGGMHPYAGGASTAGAGKDEVPNLAAALAGVNGATDPTKLAGTGISPNQVFHDALEGSEGMEQGSMAGVNGKREVSLFEITRSKLTKMFQVGNVGVSKSVEVKN